MIGSGNAAGTYNITVQSQDLDKAAAVLDMCGIGLVGLSANMEILVFNSAAATIVGAPPEMITPGSRYEVLVNHLARQGAYGEGDPEALALERLRRAEKVEQRVYRYSSSDGQVVDSRWQRREDGGLTIVYTPRPVLGRVNRDQSGSDAQIFNHRIFDVMDAMNHGIAVFSADRHLTYCNTAYVAHSRLPRNKLSPGTTVDEIVRAKAGLGVYAPLAADGSGDPAQDRARRLRSGPIEEQETLTYADGAVFELHRRELPDGGYVVTSFEVTERERTVEALRRARDEAEAANRAKSEFMANMSHELRTPLNAIIGFAEIVRGEVFGTVGNERYLDYAGDIVGSAHHLLGLINDILDLSRVESGRLELRDEDLDISESALWASDMVRPRARKTKVALSVNLPPRLPRLRGDERSLRQMLLNLLSNAVKFTPEGGDVRLDGTVTENGFLVLTVEDTGIGIPADRLKDIVEPFSQVDSSLARRFEGTGLGLTIVVRLMELHGGRMEIDSIEGEGTCVRLLFPPDRVVPAA